MRCLAEILTSEPYKHESRSSQTGKLRLMYFLSPLRCKPHGLYTAALMRASIHPSLSREQTTSHRMVWIAFLALSELRQHAAKSAECC
jgi:hypothetical protein